MNLSQDYCDHPSRPLSSKFVFLHQPLPKDTMSLTTHMEANELEQAGEELATKVDAGRLRFSLDYDFQKNEVRGYLMLCDNVLDFFTIISK